MVNLRGQFAVILLAEVPERGVEPLQEQLLSVAEQLGLTLTFCQHDAQEDKWPTTVGVPFRLRTYAMDQPGLVHRITELLHRHGVNVEELQTRSQPRPQTGAPLFSMDLLMTVPPSIPIRRLRSELQTLCEELNCDVEIQQVTL
jgi:glycine cleavage system transcriptional repressor